MYTKVMELNYWGSTTAKKATYNDATQQWEVVVDRDQDINQLFAALSAQGIDVASMRNKANRLEQLFLELTNREPGQGASGQ